MANFLSGDQWNNIKQELQNRWLDLSDQDLERTHGDYLKIIHLIEQKEMCNHDEATRSVEEVFAANEVEIPMYQDNVVNAPPNYRSRTLAKEASQGMVPPSQTKH